LSGAVDVALLDDGAGEVSGACPHAGTEMAKRATSAAPRNRCFIVSPGNRVNGSRLARKRVWLVCHFTAEGPLRTLRKRGRAATRPARCGHQYRFVLDPNRFMLEPDPAPSERWVLPCMRISFFAARNVPARSASAWHMNAPCFVWPNSRLPGKW